MRQTLCDLVQATSRISPHDLENLISNSVLSLRMSSWLYVIEMLSTRIMIGVFQAFVQLRASKLRSL